MKTKQLILISFTALLLIVGSIVLIRYNNAKNLNHATELSNLRRKLTDSIQTANNNREIEKLQLQKDSISKIVVKEKSTASYYKIVAKNQKHISDSLQNLIPKTDTTCLKAIESKQTEIVNLNTAIKKLDNVILLDSVAFNLCEGQNVLLNKNVVLKQNDLNTANKSIEKLMKSNKRNWFEKNAIWIGIVAGSVGTYLIVK